MQRLFGRTSTTSSSSTSEALNSIEIAKLALQDRLLILDSKIQTLRGQAKQHVQAGRKRNALMCLKQSKLYAEQRLKISDQLEKLNGCFNQIRPPRKNNNNCDDDDIDLVCQEDTMDPDDIQKALETPLFDFSDDDLQNELDKLLVDFDKLSFGC